MLLTVVALMAAMMAMSAGSASAFELTKEGCKQFKPVIKATGTFGGNQGQCIKGH